jgi:hypothetical protein
MSLVKSVVARYLAAAPLDEYYSYPSPTGASESVGWGRERQKSFLGEATKFFESRKDSWAIVVLSGPQVKVSDVEDYVSENPKLKRSKIIVVRDSGQSGDFTSPDWVILHDIIGHSIALHSKHRHEEYLSYYTHKSLPREFQLSENSQDLYPDIYAAIFFHSDLRDLASKAARTYAKETFVPEQEAAKAALYESNFEEFLRDMMQDVANWTSKFKPGVPRLVQLW